VQELQELLMLSRRRLLELLVEALHVVFGEAGGSHDADQFVFRNHIVSPE
jgi:hypothetical protein